MRHGTQSGVEIISVGLGKEPSGDLALRRLASAVLQSALTDLMDGDEQGNATEFFYSSEMDLWCGILNLEVGCVREELENLGLLCRYVSLVPELTTSDMMQHYIDLCEDSTDSNLEILLNLSHKLGISYAQVHYYIYEQILKWKPVYMRSELGKEFFKAWKKQKRGSSARFGLIIETFRKRITEGNCG